MTNGKRQYWVPTGLDTEVKRRLRARLPFSASAFDDRDDLGWMSLIEKRGARRLYRFMDGNMVWATIEGGRVVAVEFVEGRRAARLRDEVERKLPPERAQQIMRALRPGRDAGEAMRETFGPTLQSINDLDQRREGDHEVFLFWVDHWSPRRRGLLRLEVDGDGRIVGCELVEGRRARRLIRAARKTK
jgi:hypothetical protein